MKSAENTAMLNPVISELNQVPNFNPFKYLRNTESGPVLDLQYKKLWFRLKYPNGKIRLYNIRITDQLAIIEARVFLNRKDTDSVSNYTAQCDKSKAPNGNFLKVAQDMAIDRALSDAGFGIQFSAETGIVTETVNKTSVKVAAPEVKIQPNVVVREENTAPVVQMTEDVVDNNTAVQPVAKVVEPPAEAPTEVIKETVNSNANIAPAVAPNAAETVITNSEVVVKPEEKIIPMNNANTSGQPIAVENDPLIPVAQALKNSGLVTETPNEVAAASTPTYTKEMSVEDICAVMTLEEAENYVVPSGACVGQTMAMVADRRPASLRFYINGYSGNDNILRAAATVITRARPELLAG